MHIIRIEDLRAWLGRGAYILLFVRVHLMQPVCTGAPFCGCFFFCWLLVRDRQRLQHAACLIRVVESTSAPPPHSTPPRKNRMKQFTTANRSYRSNAPSLLGRRVINSLAAKTCKACVRIPSSLSGHPTARPPPGGGETSAISLRPGTLQECRGHWSATMACVSI